MRTTAARRRPSQARARETVAAIVEAAAQVFEAEGTAATTNRIALRAGVSIGSLYQYFADKEAIFEAVAQRHLADAAAELVPLVARLEDEPLPSATLVIGEFFRAMLQLHQGRPQLHRLILEGYTLGRKFQDSVAVFEDGIAAHVERYLARLPTPPSQPAVTARLLVQSVDALSHRWIARPASGVEDDIFVATASAFLAASLAERRRVRTSAFP